MSAGSPVLSVTEAGASVTEAFLTAFRHHPAGIAIITADAGDGPVALTVSSLISISAAPPTVAFSLSNASSSARAIRQAGAIVVHFIRRADMGLARLCATGGAERFGSGVRWDRLPTGEPYYPEVQRWFQAAIRGELVTPGACLVTAELLSVAPSARVSPARGCLGLCQSNLAHSSAHRRRRPGSSAVVAGRFGDLLTCRIRRVTCTFDKGPSVGITDAILGQLHRQGVLARFFAVGQRLDRDGTALMQAAPSGGHWIGNHTLTHNPPLQQPCRTLDEASDPLMLRGRAAGSNALGEGTRAGPVDAVSP